METNIDKAIRFLNDELAKGFTSSSSPQQHPWKPRFRYQTCFVPSLILQSLNQANQPRLHNSQKALYDYLLEQRSEHWSFNYWVRTSPEATSFPYPDDLDDTFCALIALHGFQPATIEQNALAKVVKLLIATESKVGGPYRTWLTTSDSSDWQDIDIAVNANVAYFLSCIGSNLATLDRFIGQYIKAQQFTSPYYPSAFPVWYYLARVCPPALKQKLTNSIVQATPANSLETALAINALCQLQPNHKSIQEYVKQLLRQQLTDGSWPAAAFCLDPTRNGQKYYHGSSSLTTAVALEALARFKRLGLQTKSTAQNTPHQQIVEQAQADIAKLPANLRQQSQQKLDAIIRADSKQQITLLPYLFGQSFKSRPAQLYQQLGLANLYGWMAYTIYDDFLDEEGQLALLPVANFAMRSSLYYFQTALPQTAFQKQVLEVFNIIDNANAWEVTHCRWVVKDGQLLPGKLPHYRQRIKLAERSLGHGLGPTAIMLTNGFSLSGFEVRHFQAAFRHYLIARQLDDDAHDWQDDIQKGHLSYVNSTILRELNYTQPQALQTLLPQMQQQFWQHSLVNICDTIDYHIQHGKQLSANPLLQQLLTGLEQSVQKTRAKQIQAISFLEAYEPHKIIKN